MRSSRPAASVLNWASRAATAAAFRLNTLERAARSAAGGPARGSTAAKPPTPTSYPADEPAIVWFHSIDLGNGELTPGIKSTEALAAEARQLELPRAIPGQSVLDIGTWDGYFAFEMERRGAASVTALDFYAWSTDWAAYRSYNEAVIGRGEPMLPPHELPHVWDPVGLPGRAGFDCAREALRSRVRPLVGDIMTMDITPLGAFDIVLFLGVLYHLEDPLRALKRLRTLTRRVAVIETVSVVLPGWNDEALWMFFEGAELDHDPSNWWAPTTAALEAMCRAAGFSSTKVIIESPEYAPPNPGYDVHFGRVTMHAYA